MNQEETLPLRGVEGAGAKTHARGLLIGRYVIISQLGAGAMGVVFAAFDPELDRKVALKLLKHRGGHLSTARKRLQREAQSLAKLQHPNVVSVFDVGVHGGQLFVAMEFVEGQTLGEWMSAVDAPRPWQEILDVFIAAGRGLAAAHEVGLIHRDFKPDNVMLRADGRVRVMDFGLARGDHSDEDEDEDERDWARTPVEKLTQTGAILGTPAYMSLEQFKGAELDARSDQFAFCVALYEALYGERPFASETISDLLQALKRDQIRAAPERPRVPAWLREVVVRGLSKDPGMRFESMQALLDALAADPIAQRRRWAARIGLALVIAGSVWGLGVLWTKVGEQRAVIADKEAELERQNQELRERERRLEIELSAQKGMRASMVAQTPGNELAALRLAIEAIGDFDPTTKLPAPVFSGLTSSVVELSSGLPLLGHTDKILAVAYSPDGSKIATASLDETVRLWDADSGVMLQTINGHEGAVNAVDWSRDGTRLATASADNSARVWDASSGKELASFPHEAAVLDVSISPDGAQLATAGQVGSVHVWELAGAPSETEPRFSITREGPVRALVFSPAGDWLATASDQGEISLWDARAGTPLQTFEGHEGKVLALASSADGERVASGSVDGTARVWDVASATPVGIFAQGESVHGVALASDGSWLATGSWNDNAGHLWDVASETRVSSYRHQGPVFDVAISPRTDQLTTVSWDGTARSWTIDSPRALTTLAGHTDRVDAVALSSDGARIATASGDNSARLWDADTGEALALLRGHRLEVVALSFSADGTRLATASWDGTVRLWDQSSGAPLVTLEGHEDRALTVAFSSDSAYVATGARDRTVRLWDPTSGAPVKTFTHEAPVVDVLFSPDNTRVLAIGSNDLVQVWDVSTGEALTDTAYAGAATALAFTPDGSRLAVAKDHVVQLWDLSAGASVLSFEGHSGQIGRLAFSADGARMASASNDGTARVWDATTGEELVSLTHEGTVLDLIFTADGQHVVTANAELVARSWALDAGAWFEWGCGLLDVRRAHTDQTTQVCSASARIEHTPRPPRAKVAEVTNVTAPEPARELTTVHGVEMVRIPEATITLDVPESEAKHEVHLDSFFLATTEVTNAQYAVYLDANPDVERPSGWGVNVNHPHQPVEGVSWNDAKAYCAWAGFELPTEVQWEYAASAGSTTTYWFGDEVDDLDRFSWYDGNSGGRAHTVAKKNANAFGLYDVIGNMFEWTLDAYGDHVTPPRDGDGLRHPAVGDASRVVRGGGWRDYGRDAPPDGRHGLDPNSRVNNVGFRPAMAIR